VPPAFAYETVAPDGKTVRGQTREDERGLRFGLRGSGEVLEVTRALAALLPAGLPLPRALGAAALLTTGEVRHTLEGIRQRVERGEALATALRRHPDLFDPLYLGLVRAGERSGNLAGAYARLATQLEHEQQLRARIISASIYPLLLSTLGGMAVLVILFFVIPRFAQALQDAGAVLPHSTALMLGASAMVRRFWPLALGIPIAGFLALLSYRNTEPGRRLETKLLLTLPVARSFVQDRLAAEFARLTGTLLSGGLPLLAALDNVLECTANPAARDELSRIRASVREGRSVRQSLAASPLYPPLLTQLVAVGEQSGRLKEFLLKAAEIFEERTERSLQRLVTMLEPTIVVVFGGVVAVVAYAMLQAIYGINVGTFR
jgi:type II secretory pathway component PulF